MGILLMVSFGVRLVGQVVHPAHAAAHMARHGRGVAFMSADAHTTADRQALKRVSRRRRFARRTQLSCMLTWLLLLSCAPS